MIANTLVYGYNISPASEHVESGFVIGGKQRFLGKTSHNHLPRRFPANSCKGIVVGYLFIVYSGELAIGMCKPLI